MIQQSLLLACLTPLAPIATAASPVVSPNEASITWEFENLDTTLKGARSSEKPVLLYFWANGSESCGKMYSETMANESVIESMSGFACFSADTASTVGYDLFQKYNMKTVPALIFVTPEGEVNDAVVGFIDPGGLVEELARVRAGTDTIAAFRERAHAAPEDIDVQFAYAVKLQDCGDDHGYEKVAGRIKAADPKGANVVTARLMMADIRTAIVEAAAKEDGEYDFVGVDLAAMTKFVKKVKHEDVAFNGWDWMAAVEKEREDQPAYRKAKMAAWSHASDEEVFGFTEQVGHDFWESREDLDRKEKKFFLTVASRASDLVTERLATKQEELAASNAKGCGSFEGCADGDDEGCGGCGGVAAEMVVYQANLNHTLACALYVNGKRKPAIEQLKVAMQLSPENESFTERLALFEAKK